MKWKPKDYEAAGMKIIRPSASGLKPLKLKLNGVLVEADFHMPTMKNALGLPPHDMFQDGIFYHGFNPQPPSNPLMEDVDHLMDENV